MSKHFLCLYIRTENLIISHIFAHGATFSPPAQTPIESCRGGTAEKACSRVISCPAASDKEPSHIEAESRLGKISGKKRQR